MVLWMSTIAVSVAILVITAAVGGSEPAFMTIHLLVAGMVASVMALLAVREAREFAASGETRGLVSAHLTRHMGLLWSWAALVIVITYGTGILDWSPWWQYFLTFMVCSGVCLFLSKFMLDDHAAGRPDDKIQRLSFAVAVATLFIVVVGAGAIGFARLAGAAAMQQPSSWAADHVFVFGGLAMAVVASYLLKSAGGVDEKAAADPA